jgi:exopolysaccharide biosynthesis polyprenyl glycosylphosphotransferase
MGGVAKQAYVASTQKAGASESGEASRPGATRGEVRRGSRSGATRGGPAAHFRQIALIADGLVLTLAFPLAYLIKTRLLPQDLTPLYAPEAYIAPAALVAVVTLLVLERRGAHSASELRSLPQIVRTVGAATATAVLVGATVLFAFKVSYVSRLFLALYAGSGAVLLVAVHLGLRPLVARARESGENAARLLLVGSAAEASELAERLDAESPFGVVVVERLSVENLGRAVRIEERDDEAFPELDRLLSEESIDEVAVATTDLPTADLGRLIRACEREGVPLHVCLSTFAAGLDRATLQRVGDLSLLSVNPQVHSAWARAVKRSVDFVVSPLLLLLLSPLFVLIALAIKLDSTGPVFFRQVRVGFNKRRFALLKFRTMSMDAEARRPDVEALNDADGPMFKARRDPRVTRVGRLLRRFDLDELPQLFNVLAGHMTLVGPRPMLPSEISGFASWQRKRFSMVPGITGLWQVSHRLGDSFLTGLQADLDYIDRWSLALDARILVRTVFAVLRDRGGG